MDIISTYTTARTAVLNISKDLFDFLEEKDYIGIIKKDNINYLDLIESDDPKVIKVMMYSYSAPDVHKHCILMDREAVLNLDFDIILEQWIATSKEILYKVCVSKIRKFTKEFHRNDFDLIDLTIKMSDTFTTSANDREAISKIAKTYVDSLEV